MQGQKKWLDEIQYFIKNKVYMAALSLTAVCSYGFLVTHQTVGIDDTPYTYYFEEGLNAIVGRWFLYLANKVFHVAEFSPFMTDLVGVLILMAAAVVWCSLLRRICGDKAPLWGYVFFGCIFISCPLISEVYTYYLHNGVSVGYLCTGISLCFFQEFKELLQHAGGREQKTVIRGQETETREQKTETREQETETREQKTETREQETETRGQETENGRQETETRRQETETRKRLLAAGLGSAMFLWVALGCYESFMIVWLLGVTLMLLTEKYMGMHRRVFLSLVSAAGAAVAAILLRSVMISAVIAVFDLGGMRDEAVQRSVTEMLAWMFEEGAAAEFAMVVKRFYVMYGVFAYAYYPIKVFVYAVAFMAIFSVWRGIRQRSAWIPVLTAGSFFVCFLLAVIEGKATYYRTAQFLPIICAYGAFLIMYAVHGLKGSRFSANRAAMALAPAAMALAPAATALAPATTGLARAEGASAEPEKEAARSKAMLVRAKLARGAGGVAAFVLGAVLWNQCFDMNRWFYVDWMKYEAARNTVERIALELEKGFDTSKPVVFTGQYAVPREIIADAYVQYGTETFYKLKRWTDPIDEHLLEKFYRKYGVWVAQTPELSVIEWGRNAFDDDSELVRFFAMHGFELTPYLETENYHDIEVYSLGLPNFPREGSIVDMGEYIIVHF